VTSIFTRCGIIIEKRRDTVHLEKEGALYEKQKGNPRQRERGDKNKEPVSRSGSRHKLR
jgi:hypothetical protein